MYFVRSKDLRRLRNPGSEITISSRIIFNSYLKQSTNPNHLIVDAQKIPTSMNKVREEHLFLLAGFFLVSRE